MEYLSCGSLEHCSHYCCQWRTSWMLINKIFIFYIFPLSDIDFSCFTKLFVGWPIKLFTLVWLILIPAKLTYYENSKGKKASFQPITACKVMPSHVFGTWKILVVFITHVLFITCVCCRKKTTEVLIQGCLLYHIHQDLWLVQK